MPFLYSTSLVTLLRWYTTTVPGADAERVGAVVPLLALGRDAVAAAAGDELHGLADVLGQDGLRSSSRSRILVPPLPSRVISKTVRGPMMPGWMVNLS